MAQPSEPERYQRHCPTHHEPVDDDLRCPRGHRLWVYASRPETPVWDVYDTLEKTYTYRTRLKGAGTRPRLKRVG